MNPSGCSVPLAEACSGLGAVLATVIPVPAQVPLQPELLQPPQTSQFVQALCPELSNTEPPGSNVHSANLLLH